MVHDISIICSQFIFKLGLEYDLDLRDGGKADREAAKHDDVMEHFPR